MKVSLLWQISLILMIHSNVLAFFDPDETVKLEGILAVLSPEKLDELNNLMAVLNPDRLDKLNKLIDRISRFFSDPAACDYIDPEVNCVNPQIAKECRNKCAKDSKDEENLYVCKELIADQHCNISTIAAECTDMCSKVEDPFWCSHISSASCEDEEVASGCANLCSSVACDPECQYRRCVAEDLCSCYSGWTGSKCGDRANVIKGEKGLDGRPGSGGSKGEPGSRGLTGQPGDKGDQGLDGRPGSDGESGQPGAKGDSGLDGLPGSRGEFGQPVAKGEQGPGGLPGSKGEPGLDGLPGSKGDSGQSGAKGEQGSSGLPGSKGESGQPGIKGDSGANGEIGPNGQRGVQGRSGVKGSKGEQGRLKGCAPGLSKLGTSGCYRLYNDQQRSWSAAVSKCADEGLQLAEPEDDDVLQLRSYLLDNYGDGHTWLGAQADGARFYWRGGNGGGGGTELRSSNSLWWPGYLGSRVGTGYCLGLAVSKSSRDRQPDKPYASSSCSHSTNTLCQAIP